MEKLRREQRRGAWLVHPSRELPRYEYEYSTQARGFCSRLVNGMRLYRPRINGNVSSDDEEENAPLLSGDAILRNGASASNPSCGLSALYFLVMVVNGGLVGALGPSLEPIGRAINLHDAVLAQFVLQNRLCKLVGTLVWCAYARKLQRPRGVARPHAMFAGLMLVTAASAITLGAATRPISIQAALVSWGVAYGITDSGVNTLTIWRWGNDNRRRRIDVALLNAGFTVGALIGPALVAASLRYGGGRWAFHTIALIAIIATVYLGLQPPTQLPAAPSALHESKRDDASASTLGLKQSAQPPRMLKSYYETMHEVERRNSAAYEVRFVGAMSLVVCCVTGCEHGLATWLSPYGIEQGGLSEPRMALMSSSYWGVMCAGRMLWAVLSGVVTSTWPMLFFDVCTCFVSALLLLLCRAVGAASGFFEPLLWVSAMGLGLGVASGLPCVYSLPPEAQVQLGPWSITVLNAASTLGETAFPYVIGLSFGRKQFAALGGLMSGAMALALVVALAAWRQSRNVIFSRRLENELFEF